jgi:polyferredoxin
MAAMQASSVLSTLEADGRRHWIDPKPSFGNLWRWRRAVAYILIAVFTLLPYISINSKPAILLDLSARRFTFFGKTFLPTDTLLMALLFVSMFVGIFLVTAIMGALWCGWGCPQTVYMEFVYRPIERFFSGTPGRAKTAFQQSALAMVLKFSLYCIGVVLPGPHLPGLLRRRRPAGAVGQMSPRQPPHAVPGDGRDDRPDDVRLRVLPRADLPGRVPVRRFQSVLLDRIRGSSRLRPSPGRAARQEAAPEARRRRRAAGHERRAAGGDCVDCKLCVTTCPTGIDIRNGLQMECVHCTQCIDACDAVMTRLNRPTGLIRYASEAAMEGEKPRLLRPRVVVYPTILVILVTAFVVVLLRKADTDVNVLRGMGAPFSVLADGTVANQIKVKIVNRRDRAATYTAAARGAEGVHVSSEMFPITLEPGEMKTALAILAAPPTVFKDGTCVVEVVVSDGTKDVSVTSYRMMGPATGHHGEPSR